MPESDSHDRKVVPITEDPEAVSRATRAALATRLKALFAEIEPALQRIEERVQRRLDEAAANPSPAAAAATAPFTVLPGGRR